jgi:hypothetical protein
MADDVDAGETLRVEARALTTRLVFLLAILFSVAIDLLFLAGWAFLNRFVIGWVETWGSPHGMQHLITTIFEAVFAFSTLIVVLGYVLTDLIKYLARLGLIPKSWARR